MPTWVTLHFKSSQPTDLSVPTSKCWFIELWPFDLITYSFWPCWWPPELYHWCGWGAGSHCPTPVWASHHGPGPPLQGTTRRLKNHTHYMIGLQISTTFELRSKLLWNYSNSLRSIFMVSFLRFFECNFMDLVLFIKNKEYF